MIATPKDDAQDQTPSECGVCRGTGKLNSNAGGEPHQVTCPWCEGTARFIPDHNAQGDYTAEDKSEAE